MKRLLLRYSAVMAVSLMIALLQVSCIKDNFSSGENASVTMTFTTRAQSLDAQVEGSNLLDNEQMKTLRVIVVRASNNEILYNEYYEIKPEETSKVITFSELTVKEEGEDFKFYAIANEEAFVATDNELDVIDSDKLKNLYSRVLTGGFSNNSLLPQTSFKTITVKKQSDGSVQKENMQLQFPTGKIQLTFDNQTGAEVDMSEVKISGVAPDKAYLFYQTKVPDGTTYSGNVDFGGINIPTSGTYTTHQYIYPGTAGEGKYKLTANWNNSKKELLLATEAKPNGISGIARNEMLNVTITLLPGGGLSMKLEVKDWETEESFDMNYKDNFNIQELSVLSGNPTVNGALAVAFNDDDNNLYALRLKLTIDKPYGATWTANVSNGNAFEVIKSDGNAATGIIDGTPVEVLVRPTGPLVVGQEPSTDFYINLIVNEMNQGEQVINGDDTNTILPGTKTRIKICQIAPSVWPNE